MKKFILIILLPGLFIHTGFGSSLVKTNDFNLNTLASTNDTVRYETFAGKVVDKRNGAPIVFASVFIVGTNLGTVTNSDGEFIIKIPENLLKNYIGITHIGYGRGTVPIETLKPEENIIELEILPIPIREVVVTNPDPRNLIEQAIYSIDENYPTEPMMMISFYRETIKKNRNFVGISEAVLDVYKSSYVSQIDNDRIRIFKGRKGQDVNRMDTVMFKYQGGHYTAFLLDIVKNPGDLLSIDGLDDYEYRMGGMISIDEKQTWIVEFDQKTEVEYPLYKGKIYIDTESYAIVGLEFNISPKRIVTAARYLVQKKPVGMNIDVVSGHYLTNYRYVQGKWYLTYVRTEFVLDCKWNKRLFKSTYTVMSEMAVTDITRGNINKFKIRESAKKSDVLIEKVAYFEDPDFWGDYNVIKPDESIESAISKLGRRLKRQNND